ncbi:hypothetical protein L249_3207 [Ophiocordyceps polyrhachis-furcata BCC 54312]|uniref:Uncharacterized protein n=1 Tax=Ophiocordyceps polyrhachis-furcata BCC 54312 TaxID=1330021 RepID=A0A367LPG6_9HYPO|nr:hypothetical protein L249_3207 [Ophiocordyceps polyrhachis-furcata BCC 54312]
MTRSLLAPLALLAGATLTAGGETTKSINLFQPSATQNYALGLSVITAAPQATTYEAEAFPLTCTPGVSGCEPVYGTKLTIVDGPKTYSAGWESASDGLGFSCRVDDKKDSAECTATLFVNGIGNEGSFLVRNYKAAQYPAYVTAGVERLSNGSPSFARNAIVVAGLGALVGTVVVF